MIKFIPFYADLLDEGGTQTQVLLYGLIELLSNQKGYCYASNEALAKELRLSRSRVASAISEMVNMGWVEVELDENNHRTAIYPCWSLQKRQPPLAKVGNPPLPNLATNNTSNNKQEYTMDTKVSIEATASSCEDATVAKKPVEKSEHGNSQINELMSYWEEKCGFPIKTKVQMNRFTCQRLIKSRGIDKIKSAIDVLPATFNDRYAPVIKNFKDLEDKWDALRIYCQRRMARFKTRTIVGEDGLEYTMDASGNITGIKV